MPLALLLLAALPAQLPTADEIIQKSRTRYDFAKTFQGEINIHVQSAAYEDSLLLKVKGENDGKGRSKRSAAAATDTSNSAGKKAVARRSTLDDGKNIYEVDLNTRVYRVKPHEDDHIFGVLEGPLKAIHSLLGPLSVTEAVVSGKKVYRLSAHNAQAMASVVVDKQTFNVLSLNVTRGTASTLVNMQLTLSNQVFNGKIPANTFVWKAPFGFTRAG